MNPKVHQIPNNRIVTSVLIAMLARKISTIYINGNKTDDIGKFKIGRLYFEMIYRYSLKKGVFKMENRNNEIKKESLKLAGRMYDVKDYDRKDTLSQGLAITHEQVSDAYMEGEIGGVIDDVNGTDIELDKKD